MPSDIFSSRFTNLNEGQKKAVLQTEGPVMVIAGPGTGKTETLGARIANILAQQADIKPSNILCLTYTNAGVVAMRKRLIEFIGANAQAVQIHTFHSFCNQIIQENPDIFPIKDAENISELEQYELVDNLLDHLDVKNPLFKKSGYYYSKDLLDLFSTIKSENWSRTEIEKTVHEYLNDLPNRDEYIYKKSGKSWKAGDVKQKEIDTETEKMKKLLAGVSLFEDYQLQMQKRGAYDLNDMIQWIIHAFETNDTILAKYQERFLYILVDEFQDTNGSQKKIVDLLTSYWESPNIFIVGDDDQSIYRFQGANMRNIIEFWNTYSSSVHCIAIDKNYRSSAPILALAEHCIAKNTERLTLQIPALQKKLTACHPRFSDVSSPNPELIAYETHWHETLGIFLQLKKMHQSGENLSEVAVIYKNHKQAENLIKLCQHEGIPISVRRDTDVLEIPMIKNLITMLLYCAKEIEAPFSGENLLFAMLHFPWFGISQKDIQALALSRRTIENSVFFKTLIAEATSESPFFSFCQTIHCLEKEYFSLPLLSFIELVCQKTGLLAYLLKHEQKYFLIRSFSSFFSFCQNCVQKNPDISLSELLQTIEKMRQHDIRLPIQKTLSDAKGVQFITAHSSKGLEFEHVFLMGIEKNIWKDSRKQGSFSFPDTLTMSNSENSLEEEERRLFFVAITRAKNNLSISYARCDENGKEKDPSLCILECQEVLPVQTVEFSEEEIVDMQATLFAMDQSSLPQLSFLESLPALLENYSMSATHLNKFLACPLAFYYEKLLQIPAAKSAHASFGSAVHWALEKYVCGTEKSLSHLLELFETALHKNRFGFSAVEFSKFFKHGKEILSNYYSHTLQSLSLESSTTEYFIKSTLDGVPLSGRIDRLDLVAPQTVRVIDYKTGDPKNAVEKMQKPSDKNNFLGGDYWRQMVFYALLIENNTQKSLRMAEGVFDFVESSEGFKKAFVVSDEDKAIVRSQIKNAYAMIQNGQFIGCQKEDCEWCSR